MTGNDQDPPADTSAEPFGPPTQPLQQVASYGGHPPTQPLPQVASYGGQPFTQPLPQVASYGLPTEPVAHRGRFAEWRRAHPGKTAVLSVAIAIASLAAQFSGYSWLTGHRLFGNGWFGGGGNRAPHPGTNNSNGARNLEDQGVAPGAHGTTSTTSASVTTNPAPQFTAPPTTHAPLGTTPTTVTFGTVGSISDTGRLSSGVITRSCDEVEVLTTATNGVEDVLVVFTVHINGPLRLRAEAIRIESSDASSGKITLSSTGSTSGAPTVISDPSKPRAVSNTITVPLGNLENIEGFVVTWTGLVKTIPTKVTFTMKMGVDANGALQLSLGGGNYVIPPGKSRCDPSLSL